MWIFCVAAFGGDAEVEAARAGISLGQVAEARQVAVAELAARPDDPSALRLYLEASLAGGLGSVATRELASKSDLLAPWRDPQFALESASEVADIAAITANRDALTAAFPDHPELLVPMFRATDDKKLKKLQEKTRYTLMLAVPKAPVAELYRMRALFLEAGVEGLVEIGEQLAARGEPNMPRRQPWTLLECTDAATAVARSPTPMLPTPMFASEPLEVGRRAGQQLSQLGKHAEAASLYAAVSQLDSSVDAPTLEAQALLAAGHVDGAKAAAARAFQAIAIGFRGDIGLLVAEDLGHRASTALVARAHVRDASSDLTGAWADLVTAAALTGAQGDEKLADKLSKRVTAVADTLAATYKGGLPAAVAISKSSAEPDAARAVAIANDAVVLAASTSSPRSAADHAEVLGGPLSDAYSALAAALLRHDDDASIQEAASAAQIAVLLDGGARAPTLQQLGEVQEKAGRPLLAFTAFARARGRGAAGLEDALRRTWSGVGDALEAATMIGGEPPPVSATPAPAPTSYKPVIRRPPAASSGDAVKLGATIPPFEVQTAGGTLSDQALRGKMVILSFWRSDCGECMAALPGYGTLARKLRAEGFNVVHVAISMDDREAAYEDAYRLGQRWGELARAPEVGVAWDVQRLPTTWVVDRNGVAKYFVDRRVSPDDLEVALRPFLLE